MAEKTGNTVKLSYDFDTAGVLEVYLPKLEGWYRSTARDFRSFDGKRRITLPKKVEKGNPWVELETSEYNGPVYIWDTNTEVEKRENTGKIVTSPNWVKRQKISGSRG